MGHDIAPNDQPPPGATPDTVPVALTLHAADGVDLEAEVAVPDRVQARVVLAHPHPQFGGSMRSLVTSELFRTVPARGLAALRFNFRGVEGSGGTHEEGRGEQLDLSAAIQTLDERVPGPGPLIVAGWSFGADVALAVIDDRIDGWFLIAPPLRVLPPEELRAAAQARPKLVVVGEHDQISPPDRVADRTKAWESTRVELVAGADHFFAGKTARVAELLVAFSEAITEQPGPP